MVGSDAFETLVRKFGRSEEGWDPDQYRLQREKLELMRLQKELKRLLIEVLKEAKMLSYIDTLESLKETITR